MCYVVLWSQLWPHEGFYTHIVLLQDVWTQVVHIWTLAPLEACCLKGGCSRWSSYPSTNPKIMNSHPVNLRFKNLVVHYLSAPNCLNLSISDSCGPKKRGIPPCFSEFLRSCHPHVTKKTDNVRSPPNYILFFHSPSLACTAMNLPILIPWWQMGLSYF